MTERDFQPTPGCAQFDRELMDYLEGEARPFVSTHARECAFCSVLLADLEQLRFSARQLPLQEPSPSVWANLHARLEQEGLIRPRVRGWDWLESLRALARPAPLGALASLAILGAMFIASPIALQVPESAASVSTAPQAAVVASASFADDRELARMTQDLEATFRANEGLLAPETRDTYEKGLTSLDDSIRECKDSLRQKPDNTLAQDYLLTAYTRKAEILTTALEFQGR